MTGRTVKAEEALSIGLISKIVPQAELIQQAMEIVRAISRKGPLAVRLTKQAINASLATDEDTGMLVEALSYGLVIASDDRMEGVDAFLEKRPPHFSGH